VATPVETELRLLDASPSSASVPVEAVAQKEHAARRARLARQGRALVLLSVLLGVLGTAVTIYETWIA
jgi:hypothetical protein